MVQIIHRTGPKPKQVIWDVPIEPVPYALNPIEKRICIMDTETDPFYPGLVVKPFTCGFLDTFDNSYKDFWGDDCIDQLFDYIWEAYTRHNIELIILVHNGGNFDFYFFTKYFDPDSKPFIINGRLVKVQAGGQEWRDSYSMIPVALGEYDKLKVTNGIPLGDEYEAKRESDYDVMQLWPVCDIITRCEMTVREYYKDHILEYQKRDCTSLAELVTQWFDMFGNKLTMASVALPMLRSYQGFETLTNKLDHDLRPYYFGGRNQCFATGVMHGDFKVYDLNSSYPDVMRRFMHPISDMPKYEHTITTKTHFAYIRAWSLGALPVRQKDGSLAFPIGTFDFHACIHEIQAGLETKTLRIIKVYHSIYFEKEANFAEFIDDFYAKRMEAREAGDSVRTLFYKLVMNSSYGKFAQDPRKYENWLFDPEHIPTPTYCDTCYKEQASNDGKYEPCEHCAATISSPFGWYLHTQHEGRNIYAAPQRIRASSFFNVATAASITSAARASLLRGIQQATRPVYCDTDSIICERLDEGNGITLHAKNLGAWDTEASGDTVCIAGKKLYAVFNAGTVVKKASKGVNLTAEQIRRICDGEVIEYAHPVPKFSLSKETMFTTRKIKRTAI